MTLFIFLLGVIVGAGRLLQNLIFQGKTKMELVVAHKMEYRINDDDSATWKCTECDREYRVYPYGFQMINHGERGVHHSGEHGACIIGINFQQPLLSN